jgi:hypothetical protein
MRRDPREPSLPTRELASPAFHTSPSSERMAGSDEVTMVTVHQGMAGRRPDRGNSGAPSGLFLNRHYRHYIQ